MTQDHHEAGKMIRKGAIEPAGVGFILSSDLAGCKRPRWAKVTQKLAMPTTHVWCRLREGRTQLYQMTRGPLCSYLDVCTQLSAGDGPCIIDAEDATRMV